MELVAHIKDLYENEFQPCLNLPSGKNYRYHIKMNNLFLNMTGDIVKWQNLESQYTRKIIESIPESYVLNDFVMDQVLFSSSRKTEPMHWTFGENFKIPYFLIDSKFIGTETLSRRIVLLKAKEQVEKLWKEVQRFPKLSSVYLFIMQIYDIISFETFMGSLTSLRLKCNMIGETFELKNISETQSSLGLGFYSEESIFKNGIFNVTFMGYTSFKEKSCAFFLYRCDGSKVKMVDDVLKAKREGEFILFWNAYN